MTIARGRFAGFLCLALALPAAGRAAAGGPCGAERKQKAGKILSQSIEELAPRTPPRAPSPARAASDGVRMRIAPLVRKSALGCFRADESLLRLLLKASALICVEDEYLSGLEYLVDLQHARGYDEGLKALPPDQSRCLRDAVSGYEQERREGNG